MTLVVRVLRLLPAIAALAMAGVDAAACSEAEAEVTHSFAANSSAVCGVDTCSEECVAHMGDFVKVAPDCEYSDGVNYLESVQQTIEACAPFTVAPDGTGCSEADAVLTDTYTDEFSSVSACWTNTCNSECIDTVDRFAALLPNCTYTDGINWRGLILEVTAYCNGSATYSGDDVIGPNTTLEDIWGQGPDASSADGSISSDSRSDAGPSSAGSNGATSVGAYSVAVAAVVVALVAIELD